MDTLHVQDKENMEMQRMWAENGKPRDTVHVQDEENVEMQRMWVEYGKSRDTCMYKIKKRMWVDMKWHLLLVLNIVS
jgi:hypothetical protein